MASLCHNESHDITEDQTVTNMVNTNNTEIKVQLHTFTRKNSVPADGLASLKGKLSTATVITSVYKGLALKVLSVTVICYIN